VTRKSDALTVIRAMTGAPLSLAARVVLVQLAIDASGTEGDCNSSSREIGEDVGLQIRAVERALKELRELGAIACAGSTRSRRIRILPEAVDRRFAPPRGLQLPHVETVDLPHVETGIAADSRQTPAKLPHVETGPPTYSVEDQNLYREEEDEQQASAEGRVDPPEPVLRTPHQHARVTGTREDPIDVVVLAELVRLEQDANPEEETRHAPAMTAVRQRLVAGWSREKLEAWFAFASGRGVKVRRWTFLLGPVPWLADMRERWEAGWSDAPVALRDYEAEDRAVADRKAADLAARRAALKNAAAKAAK
jgi:hypothetical protein